ncbi:tRNA1(Val) (adenine(37)-N6)-methyltransferase [Pinibacter aurantiacus]|uniref:tRNA1(Val) (adenine(37)-N6)-methyltransferase n=1 Tax=Pinibacter aurantiacus TaxID=2851599 RepID=A0A9E2S7C2_9BACT|nr:methyltransferase [Pinibacter aurantiacus]MBV4355824.1 methyltransferase [Pinibacter aurantiacus]
MANTFFRFKQFLIHQDRCAMKVCTDACVFGAWVAKEWKDGQEKLNVLDIGTGTGLLTLMLAQKVNASFNSVEIDDHAFEQASQNFAESDWKDRISIHHNDITQFSTSQKFDLIVSNPPFYEKDLKSDKHKINLARHDSSLTLSTLLQTCNALLADEGSVVLLLPFHRLADLEKEAQANGLHFAHLLRMKQTTTHDYFRLGAVLRRQPAICIVEDITIKDVSQQYTNEFVELLKDYYLYL